jgi:hypothetical protein
MNIKTKLLLSFLAGMAALVILGASTKTFSPRPFFFNVEVGTTNGVNINLDGTGQILVGANQDIALNNDGSASFAHGAAGFGATGVGNLTTDGGLVSSDGSGNLTAVSFVGPVSKALDLWDLTGTASILHGTTASGNVDQVNPVSHETNYFAHYNIIGDEADVEVFAGGGSKIHLSSSGTVAVTGTATFTSTVTATSFSGSGTAAEHGVVILVSGTNQVDSNYAYSTNAIICTPIVGDATNFTVSVSNIVEGASFTIFASTATTNKVSYAIFP